MSRFNNSASSAASVACEREQLSHSLGQALRTLRSISGSIKEPVEASDFLWDSHQDTRYAHEITGLDGVLHVFQQDWVGIRAAAGSLPGRKLALKPDVALAGPRVRELVDAIGRTAPRRIVIQGMSGLMGQLVEELARQGMRDRIFVVFHGAPTQWCSAAEARYAFKCLELANSGKIRRLHVMKAGFEFPEPRLYRPMLFNLSPRLQEEESSTLRDAREQRASVLIPGWSGWCKNIHTSALGAALSPRVDKILAFGRDLALPPPLGSKVEIVSFINREQTFSLFKAVPLVMNVSLADCHPMVNLEAQVHGTPCLRGRLFLDALEDHPYVRLTEVLDVSSPAEIRTGVERVLDVDRAERCALARDYQTASDRLALQRYHDFLEL